MDGIIPNVTAWCPSAFSGATGEMFAGAVAAVVAAHCAFVAAPWPADSSHQIVDKATELSYDFIVVGAGTAGSLVASRLSKHWSVLLLEAGGDPGLDSEIPAFLYNNQKTANDWNYKTEPDGTSCLGLRHERCTWSKGKCMGGSSSINAMLYITGHHADYDSWQSLGNTGWGYKDLSLYFDKVEKNLNLNDYRFNANPLYNLFEEAYKELGVLPIDKLSNEAIIGTKITKLLTRNGKRLNTAKIFINESLNLHILKNAVVRKVIIDADSKITVGVEVQVTNGKIMQINVRKEVILSAGSIGTPQILMLSGIGPKKHLEEKKINSIINLPVGQNLQDHIFFPIYLSIKDTVPIPPEAFTFFVMQYVLTRTGPLSTIGVTDFMAFINPNDNNIPNIQLHHMYIPKNDQLMLKIYMNNTGYKAEVIEAVAKLNKDYELIGLYPTLLHPKSKGEVLLADNNPTSKPVIKPNYFKNPDDLKQLIESVRFVSKLHNTNTFKALNAKLVQIKLPFCTEFSFNTNNYWDCYIRHMATTVYHPVGTAKMGMKEDPNSVVDYNLMVHGVEKLRVVDASVMPGIVGANTMATTLAIAEKAVDMIIKLYNVKDEL
ncbi:glucose dehydrogenase [FAD, quinone]-like [Cydia pomonella]|uniref:glucose dehydrogenase [FAD, quinone]-like n=1 Tax=Cydia pomonella TaxID=82600 RepID=UPI002ADD666A|nr:glucose dehydrogenase [FAD, quinone]-like [Cydia pomonella]